MVAAVATPHSMFKSLWAPSMGAALTMMVAVGCKTPARELAGTANETVYPFETRKGETTTAFRGRFRVPENRSNPESRSIEIHYVRFPTTAKSPGPPIVYLAGGPGGSGVATARGRRFPLFMAMRAFGDVIALDQRGTGWSATGPDCPLEADLDVQEPSVAQMRRALDACGVFWRKKGFDPAGYTTVESARDLEALRQHLGVDKLALWGISYGTHLALAAVKILGPRVHRLVLASAEGLDQTVKRPSRTDAYFDRLQAVVDKQPAAKAMFPDIAALMRRVHHALEAKPVTLQLPLQGGLQPFQLTKGVMQMLASGSIADPAGAARLLQLYAAVDAGIYAPLSPVFAKYYPYVRPRTVALMPTAMDIASGISVERLEAVQHEAQDAILGDVLNYPMPHLAGSLGLDLGEKFRTPPRSDVPTLLLSGTLDGRTYPESQREAVAGLSNTTMVTVVHAGHNLFMVSPEVTNVIERFMRGELRSDQIIQVEAPRFLPK